MGPPEHGGRLRRGCRFRRYNHLFHARIEAVYRSHIPTGNQVAILVDGDLNGAMAHLVFHIHGALAVLEQEGGERMAEIMEAHLPHAGALQEPEELKPYPVLMERLALNSRSKDCSERWALEDQLS